MNLSKNMLTKAVIEDSMNTSNSPVRDTIRDVAGALGNTCKLAKDLTLTARIVVARINDELIDDAVKTQSKEEA